VSTVVAVRAKRAITETGTGFAWREAVRKPEVSFSPRDARVVRITEWALAALVMLLIGMTASAFAQNATATPTPMVMPTIPQIQLQTVPGYGPAPLTVGFFVSSVNPDAAPLASYIWNFGDGQISMLPPTALFHTYKNPGSYVVNVTVTDTAGHQASSFAGVIVTQTAAQ
jgi:PKD repeat protein